MANKGDYLVKCENCGGDMMVNSLTVSVTERPKKMVVDDGTKTFTDAKDVDSAKLWFHSLPPEVFSYLVLREMNNNNGVVDMVKLHKQEIGNL